MDPQKQRYIQHNTSYNAFNVSLEQKLEKLAKYSALSGATKAKADGLIKQVKHLGVCNEVLFSLSEHCCLVTNQLLSYGVGDAGFFTTCEFVRFFVGQMYEAMCGNMMLGFRYVS